MLLLQSERVPFANMFCLSWGLTNCSFSICASVTNSAFTIHGNSKEELRQLLAVLATCKNHIPYIFVHHSGSTVSGSVLYVSF